MQNFCKNPSVLYVEKYSNIETLTHLESTRSRNIHCLGWVEIFQRFWNFSAGIKMAFSVEREIFVSSYLYDGCEGSDGCMHKIVAVNKVTVRYWHPLRNSEYWILQWELEALQFPVTQAGWAGRIPERKYFHCNLKISPELILIGVRPVCNEQKLMRVSSVQFNHSQILSQ